MKRKNKIDRVVKTTEEFVITASDTNDMFKVKTYLDDVAVNYKQLDKHTIFVDANQVVTEIDHIESLLSKNNQPVNTEAKSWRLVDAYYEKEAQESYA